MTANPIGPTKVLPRAAQRRGRLVTVILAAFFAGWATFAFALFDVGRFSITVLLLASCALCMSGVRLSPWVFFSGCLLFTSTVLAWGISLVNQPGNVRNYTHITQALLAIGVMFGASAIDWEFQLPRMQKLVAIVACVLVSFGCYQFAARVLSLPYAFLPVTNQQIMADEGLQLGYSQVYQGAGGFTRVSSFFPEPSDLGRFMLWVLAIGFACQERTRRLVLLAVAAVGLVLSQSAGAILGFGFLTGVTLMVRRDPRGLLLAAILLAAATASFWRLFPDEAERLGSRVIRLVVERDFEQEGRFRYTGDTLAVFRKAPLFGHGMASVTAVTPPDTVVSSSYMFNLVERGIVGSALFYFPFVLVFLRLCLSGSRYDEITQTALLLLACELYFFATFARIYFPPIYFALGFAASCVSLRRLGSAAVTGLAAGGHGPEPAFANRLGRGCVRHKTNRHEAIGLRLRVEIPKKRRVFLVDPRASTPAYDKALLAALRRQGENAALLTSDFYPDTYEKASHKPGREYYFLRLSRYVRRRYKGKRAFVQFAIWFSPLEYTLDLIRLVCRALWCRPTVHTLWPFVVPLDILFLLFVKAIGLRTVYTVHNPLPHDGETRLNIILYRILYQLADHLIFHCRATADDFRRVFPLRDGRWSIVPCGIFFADREPVNRRDARSRLGWSNDEVVVVFQGQVKPYKGLDILLRTFADLQTTERLRLVVSGNFRFADRADYSRMLEVIREKYQVDVVDEVPSDERYVDLACGADLFVLPYRSGTASVPGMTAVRFGTPMIVTNVGALPDMLGESLKDFVVEAGDVNALRAAFERFLRLDADQRKMVGDIIKRRGEDHFGWDNIARKTIGVYEALESPSGRG